MTFAEAKSEEDYWADWESYVFGFGYGDGEAHIVPLLKRFFSAIPASGTYDYRILESLVGAEQTWLLINILCSADIFEYGSSSRFGWLTEYGVKLKAFIEKHSAEALIAMIQNRFDSFKCDPNICNCDGEKRCVSPFWSEQK